MAISADIAAGNVQSHHAAPDRGPERDVNLVFQVRARFRAFSSGRSPTSAKNSGENVAEAAASRAAGSPARTPAFEHVRKVEAAEIKVGTLAASASRLASRETSESASSSWAATRIGVGGGWIDVVRIEAKLVVDLALFGITQDVIGLGHGLELFFRRFVTRIDVGMVFAR